MTKFSEYLQHQMDEREWTQADLARASGASSKNVSVWMKQGVIPRADGLEKIAKAFGISENEVRQAAGEAPKSGYFRLIQERKDDADTLDREQARIVSDLIRKFAEDNRKAVMEDGNSTPNKRAGGRPAEDDDKVTPMLDFRDRRAPDRVAALKQPKNLPPSQGRNAGEESQDPDGL